MSHQLENIIKKVNKIHTWVCNVKEMTLSFLKEKEKENPSALLMGMQTGAATVENSMEFPQKTKNGTAF